MGREVKRVPLDFNWPLETSWDSEDEVPEGDAWQIWSTTSDAPMSPVYATSEELICWMTTEPWVLNPEPAAPGVPVYIPVDRGTAERFIDVGYAPSFVGFGSRLIDGVLFFASEAGAES